ncbi:MAG: hypothetical protein IJY25_04245 [Bacilli bacterium]|nr:hypothetical protein [Bacilli bacterium]
MKKNIIIVLVILVVLIVGFIGIKFISFGTENAMMGASLIEMEVPKLSTLSEECCVYQATFSTLRGKKSIQKELDNMVEKYQKINCNGKTAYYDLANNVTIFEYSVESSGLFTKYTIKYNKGQTCE